MSKVNVPGLVAFFATVESREARIEAEQVLRLLRAAEEKAAETDGPVYDPGGSRFERGARSGRTGVKAPRKCWRSLAR